MGFDWDSSGSTTITTAVLREAIRKANIPILIAGGKGAKAKKTPEEIEELGYELNFSTNLIEKLKMISRIVAKIDSVLLQDGYSLYHHVILASKEGYWTVIQQGMNLELKLARRYHWNYQVESYVENPHRGILGVKVHDTVLNLTSKKSHETRQCLVEIACEKPKKVRSLLLQALRVVKGDQSIERYITNQEKEIKTKWNIKAYRIEPTKVNWKALEEAYERQCRNIIELLNIKGLGPSTIRALALISNIIYGTEIDWTDPLRYGYAFGGKDGVPYPVNKRLMDEVISILEEAVDRAKGKIEYRVLKHLKNIIPRRKHISYIVYVKNPQ